MNYLKITFILILITLKTATAIEQINSSLSSGDSVKTEIIGVYPDSCPNITTIFKATNQLGEPVWDLEPEQLIVMEDGDTCEVLVLERISDKRNLQIGLVLDQSGSMDHDWDQFFRLKGDSIVRMDMDVFFSMV